MFLTSVGLYCRSEVKELGSKKIEVEGFKLQRNLGGEASIQAVR
jgi:hypothetical protein